METTFERLKKFYLKHKFVADCVFISVLFFIGCFTPIGAILAFSLIFALVLLSDLKKGISYVFFSIGFCYVAQTKSIILMLVCLITYVCKIIYIKYFVEKNKINKKTFIVWAAFLLYLIFPFKNIYNTGLLIKILLVYAVFILVYLLINFPEEFRLKFNLNIITIGVVMSCVFSLTYFISPYLSTITAIFMGRRYNGLLNNPNVLAMICEMVMSLLTYFILSKDYSYKEIISFVALAFLGILTFSKAFLILLALMLAIMFFWNIKKISLKGWIIIGLLVGVGVAVCIIKFDVLLIYVKRFMRLDTTGMGFEQFASILTTSRWDLWVQYIKYLINNPLVIFFGRGLGAPIVSVNSTHNMYLGMIYQIGLVGIALYITTFVVMLKSVKKSGTVGFNKAMIVPILAFALLCLEEDLIFFIY